MHVMLFLYFLRLFYQTQDLYNSATSSLSYVFAFESRISFANFFIVCFPVYCRTGATLDPRYVQCLCRIWSLILGFTVLSIDGISPVVPHELIYKTTADHSRNYIWRSSDPSFFLQLDCINVTQTQNGLQMCIYACRWTANFSPLSRRQESRLSVF